MFALVGLPSGLAWLGARPLIAIAMGGSVANMLAEENTCSLPGAERIYVLRTPTYDVHGHLSKTHSLGRGRTFRTVLL